MLDVYSTSVLTRVIQQLKRPRTFLLTRFFPLIEQSEKEEIKFDVANGKRRISPFVSPLREGKIVESLGYRTDTFSPAYVKDKRVLRPAAALKRVAGEQIGGGLTAANRQQAKLNTELIDQTDMLTRRLEVMAAETMLTGKVTVKGDGFDTVVVDFGRAAGHTLTLAGTNRWGQADGNPLSDIEDWSLMVLQGSGEVVTDVVMDTDAWKEFRKDPEAKELLSSLRKGSDVVLATVLAGIEGMQYMGTDGSRNYYVYTSWYVDPDTDIEVPLLPSGTVLLGSPGMQGTRHFGAILDEEAGLQALEYFAKSWTIKDPSVRYLLMQSAPLMVPYKPNASFCASVL